MSSLMRPFLYRAMNKTDEASSSSNEDGAEDEDDEACARRCREAVEQAAKAHNEWLRGLRTKRLRRRHTTGALDNGLK